MDLNQKYAAHQTAVIRAAAAESDRLRNHHLVEATDIAEQIHDFQRKLGAAASCSWSASQLSSAAELVTDLRS